LKWVPLKRFQIQDLIESPAQKVSLPECIIFYKPQNDLRVSILVGRKLGKSNERNRIRRRLREALRTASRLESGLWIIMGRKPAMTEDFDILRSSVTKGIQKVMAWEGQSAD
jgi:ribonuclease P protein component